MYVKCVKVKSTNVETGSRGRMTATINSLLVYVGAG